MEEASRTGSGLLRSSTPGEEEQGLSSLKRFSLYFLLFVKWETPSFPLTKETTGGTYVSFIFFDDHLLRAVIFSIFSYFFDTIVEFAIALSGLEDSSALAISS